MSIRTTFILALLTAIYLALELGFNARLLDALGGEISTDQVHNLEHYGRWLTGLAAALFLLQVAIHLRQHIRPSLLPAWSLATALACGGLAFGVYQSLDRLTEYLVARSSGEFRRASMTAVLAKSAMVSGVTRLGNLSDDPGVLHQPEGKAFLALFPLFASSMSSLESEFAPDKKEQVRQIIEREMGGPATYYAGYKRAIGETHASWKRYRDNSPDQLRARIDGSLKAEQDKAWNNYVRDLGRRGWSPYTVPYAYQERVRKKVQGRVPVANDWDLSDEESFRAAVARKAERSAGKRLNATSVTIGGSAVPFGLGWEAFLAHPGVQSQLRDQLKLPRGVQLQPRYASGDAFRRAVFEPAMAAPFRKMWPAYEADSTQLADGGRYEDIGRDAARAVIVPPLALFFSLLGALMHLTKLACMLSYAALRQTPGAARHTGRVLGAILLVAVLGMASLCVIDNRFTRSAGYQALENKIASSEESPLAGWLMARGLHAVAVGQGMFFPVNEAIRTRLLFEMEYGFNPQQQGTPEHEDQS